MRLLRSLIASLVLGGLACGRVPAPGTPLEETLWRHVEAGNQFSREGRDEDARLAYAAALEIGEKEDPAGLGAAVPLFGLARVEMKKGNLPGAEAFDRQEYPEAERFWLQAILNGEASGVSDAKLVRPLSLLAMPEEKQGKYAEAERPLRRLLMILRGERGEDHPDVVHTLNRLAKNQADQGRRPAAAALFAEALAVEERALRSDTGAVVAHSISSWESGDPVVRPGWPAEPLRALTGLADVHRSEGRVTDERALSKGR